MNKKNEKNAIPPGKTEDATTSILKNEPHGQWIKGYFTRISTLVFSCIRVKYIKENSALNVRPEFSSELTRMLPKSCLRVASVLP